MVKMKRMKNTIVTLLSVILLCGSSIPVNASPKYMDDSGISDVEGYHEQSQPLWNCYGDSYFYANESGGLTKVFTEDYSWRELGKMYVENYDSSFQLLSRYEIAAELPLFGTFFAGADYNYIVFGQANPDEDNNKEVIRVVKYSKNWERLGQASAYGAYTTVPFDFGSCRRAEYGGMLYIRTCHQMYRSKSDGLRHQANMMLAVRENDMTLTDHYWFVEFENKGYVSHSFDQYVIVDKEQNVVTLDLGDAYPRAVVLNRYWTDKAGSEELGATEWAYIQKISGEIGDNNTRTTIGGFAETDGGYVTAYSYNGGSGPKSLYLAYTEKENLSTRKIQLSAPGVSVSTMKLVPMGTSGGYVLWNDSSSGETVLYYAKYGADGSVGEFHAANAILYGGDPIYYNGKIVWMGYDRTNIVSGVQYDTVVNFYLLDDTGLQTITLPAEYPYQKPYFLF